MPAGPKVRIVRDDLSRPEVRALLEEHLAHMYEVTPPESVHALDVDGLRQPDVTFWTLWQGAELLGCGALKEVAPDHGEVKAMRTPQALRGRGAAKALLAHIVSEARARGYHRLSLETGSMEAFRPARGLYERAGFGYCGPFAGYGPDPNSVFMTLDLATGGNAAMRDEVLRFWFEETDPKSWWKADPHFDRLIADRFGRLLLQASRCELFGWRSDPRGRLAEIIVLDQFSRNVHRGTPRAFAQDPLALALAQEAVAAGIHHGMKPVERAFLFLPYMHSESRAIHEVAEVLYREFAPEDNYAFELKHKVIVDRFGRYPHRNEVLGRVSTAEELEFLKQPGSSF
jgi:uncharacterized protein (DUF924 family)/GNAT superfamily N-acetyltransferase